MKKVLFIHGSADLYGASKSLLSTLKVLDKRLIGAVVILPYREILDRKISSLGIAVEVGPVAVLRRQNFNLVGILLLVRDLFRSIFFIRRLDKAYNFDAIYTSTSAVISGAVYAGLFGKKHIWSVLEITVRPKLFNYLMPRFINMFSDVCICKSNAVKRYVCSGNMKESNAEVVYGGTSLPMEMGYAEAPIPHGKITVGMIGRFNRMKGQEVFVMAASLIKEEGHDFRFLIIGNPFKNEETYLIRIKALVAELHLEGNVEMLGFSENIARLYQEMDMLVVPSTEPEALGMVAAEAMAMKKPVIASDIGGLPEIVVDGETGILFEPGNAAGLKDAILRLASDSDLRERMGKAGFERQQLYFTEERHQKEINRIIMSVFKDEKLR